MATAATALDSARVYLNDVNAQIWTNAILLPYLKEAHNDLVLVLWLNGLPVLKEKSTSLAVTALQLDLDSQPADLVEPIWLKERSFGSSDDWIDMTEKDFEPDISQTSELRYWTWREDLIKFVGATTKREVLMRYWKSLTVLTAAGDSLGFIFSEFFLGPQTAAYAAGSVGNLTLAAELLFVKGVNIGVAGAKLHMIIQGNIKGQQNLPARRIPYRRFSRSRSL
jgi:hypothetical protein